MEIVFRCALCGQIYRAPSVFAGRKARCRDCGHEQQVVGPLAPPEEPTVYGVLPGGQAEPSRGLEARVEGRASRRSGEGWAGALRGALAESSQVQGLAVFLLLLSVADLLMTFTLLRAHPSFVEGNPVARWFFHRWNMAGMALFKFGMIGGVIALAEVIERRRPGWGRFVLLVGIVGAAYAVWKGLGLYIGHARGELRLD